MSTRKIFRKWASSVLAVSMIFLGCGQNVSFAQMTMPLPGGTPNYFGPEPNWANSPIIRKFVDSLPGLTPAGANNLGQYIPVAVSDTTTYPGSDYYEIALVQYIQKMHSDLPPTTLRGYVQLETASNFNISKHIALKNPDGTPILKADGTQAVAVDIPRYLGPIITAQKDVPVRVKFANLLPTGSGGNLFIPVDTTIMGAGMGPLEMNTTPGFPMNYTQNRGTLHLHGGVTPWISDGTPHQWITPAGEQTNYPKGVSVQNVPDMPDPGPGSQTFFYTNQQSARLMFYHDHAYGITRLNVYAGEAAGYLLTDPTEKDLVSRGILPADQIPLIIQDKSFVDAAKVLTTDPTWNWGPMPGMPMTGDLWFPHVYMPNQNPNDLAGINAMGRWDYGPWFWPPWPVKNQPITDPATGTIYPSLPNTSMTMEAYHDTPVVNGTAYPYINVQPKAYRFRILNAANDRMWNLQLYVADPAANTEVRMVPAVQGAAAFPVEWTAQTPGQPGDILDGRTGGVPDPELMGPSMIQIGTEGGFLPTPVVWSNIPIGFDRDVKSITVGNVKEHNLFLGPAERADVIIDFSQYAGQTLILYNDSPAAVPAADSRLDYYTGDLDNTSVGGAPSTLPGYGPNTRTIMQIRVAAATPAPAFNKAALDAEFASTATKLGVFARSQDPIIVPQATYNTAYNASFPSGTTAYARIQSTSLTFTPVGASAAVTIPFQPKAIQELFENDYGRMNATLGVELPFTNGNNQTTLPYGYIDPTTEVIDETTLATPIGATGDGTQIWKITHNGVDTHPIHFHLFNVQLINRVDWAGVVKPPEPNELGWKETVRMNPLEDAIVAIRAVAPKQPFGIPDSIRPLDPTMPIGATSNFFNVDPNGNPITPPLTNQLANFGWEYVWHCHILSHEEMDMMRPVKFNVARTLPAAPVLSVALAGNAMKLNWTDGTPVSNPLTLGDPANEIGYRIERAIVLNGTPGAYSVIGKALANTITYTDSTITIGPVYSYRVVAYNAAGDSPSVPVMLNTVPTPIPASGLVGTVINYHQVNLSWTDNSTNETGFRIERAVGAGAFASIGTVLANVTRFNDTAAPSNSSLRYRVIAYNASGNAPASNVVTVTTPQPPPVAPTNLLATINASTQIGLTWRDNSTNETSFAVWRSVNGTAAVQIGTVIRTGTQITSTGGSVTYNNTGLTAGNTYAYYVTAVNTTGPSPASNTVTVNFTTPAAPTSLVGTAVRSTLSSDTVTLRWTDNANNESGFQIQRALTSSFILPTSFTVGANATTFQQSVTRPGTYYYRVRANNAIGNSGWSNPVRVVAP